MAVEYTNIDNILSFYEKNENANYTIYRGIKCVHVADMYKGANADEGYNQLNEFLKTVNNSNEYVLQIMPKVAKDVAPSCIFKLEKKEERQQLGNYYVNGNAEILNRLSNIENSLNTDADEDYIEQPEEKNFIGQILDTEGFKEMIISGIGSLIANFLQPKIEDKIILNGINETQNADESLKILFSKGLTENDLFILSKKSKVELNYLLKILRS